jgi:hypothetical protein
MNGGSDALAAGHDSVWKAPIREGTAVMKFALHSGNNTFSDPSSLQEVRTGSRLRLVGSSLRYCSGSDEAAAGPDC